jgi:hypothetical protein
MYNYSSRQRSSSLTIAFGMQMTTDEVVVFSHDFFAAGACAAATIDQRRSSQSDREAQRRIALGRASWCQAFWLPALQRKHLDSFKLAIDGTNLTIISTSTTKRHENNDETSPSSSIDWNKLLQAALKKIVVQDLGDLHAKELLATIPINDDAQGRGQADLAAMEKQLAVKVVWMLDDGGHVLLVGSKAKLDKKCGAIRNMLSHYYWRLTGKQVHL